MKVHALLAAAFVCVSQILQAVVEHPAVTPRYAGAQPNEWTMDYDAALEAASTNGLPVIVMFTGSWWCPFCQTLDRNVLSTQAWSDYLEDNPAMLVFLDFNKRGNYTYADTNKWFLADSDYLTANAITPEEAEASHRYHEEIQMDFSITDKTAYSPEDWNVYNLRVGYPTWVVLDSTGKRRARLPVSSVPNAATAIDWLEQALASDPADELDDYRHWQPTALTPPGNCDLPQLIEASLSANDLNDWYTLDTVAGSKVTLTIAKIPGSADFLTATWYEDKAQKKQTRFSLSRGLTLTIPQLAGKEYAFSIGVNGDKLTAKTPYTLTLARTTPDIVLTLANTAVSVNETAGHVDLGVKINRNGRNDQEITLDYRTVTGADEAGIAAPDEDYTPVAGTLTWAPADSAPKTVRIPIIDNGIHKGNQTFTVEFESTSGCEVSMPSDTATVTIVEAMPYKPGTLAFTTPAKPALVAREGQSLTLGVERSKYNAGNAEATVTLSGAGAARFTEQTQTLQWFNGELGEKTVTFTLPANDAIEADAAFTVKLASPTRSIALANASLTGSVVDQTLTQTLADYVKGGDSPVAWKTSGSRWFWNDGSTFGAAGLSTDTLSPGAKPAVLTASLATPGVLTFTAKGDNGTLTAKVGAVTQTFTLDGTAQPAFFFAKTAKTAVTLTFTPAATNAQAIVADTAWYPLTAPELVSPQTKSAFAIPAGGRGIALAWAGPDLAALPAEVAAVYCLNDTFVSSNRTAILTLDPVTEPTAYTGALELRVTYGDETLSLKDKPFTWTLLPEGATAFDLDFNSYTNSLWYIDGDTAAGTTLNIELRKAVYDKVGPLTLANADSSTRAVLVSGKLPAGMKLAFEDGALLLAGTATTVGEGSCLIQVETKPEGSRSYVKGETILITHTVIDLPAWAMGTFHGRFYPNSLYFPGLISGGTTTLTVSKTGAVTGKHTFGGKSYSFKAASFSSEENGFLVFDSSFIVDRTIYPFKGGIYADSTGDTAQGVVSMIDTFLFQPFAAAWQQQWALPGQDLTPYAGYYTFALADQTAEATGFGYMTATIDKKGAVKLAGKTTDGQAFSASAALLNLRKGAATAPVFFFGASPSAYKGGDMTGMVTLTSHGTPVATTNEVAFSWFSFSSKNPAALLPANTNFTGRIIGGWFTKNEDLAPLYASLGLVFGLPAMPELTATQTGPGGKATVRFPAANPSPDGLPIAITLDRNGIGTGIAAPAIGKPVKREDGAYDYSAENTAALAAKVARTTGLLSGSVTGWYDYPANLATPERITHTSKKITYAGIWIQHTDFIDDTGYTPEKQMNGTLFFGSLPVPRTRVGSDNKPYTVNEQIPLKIKLDLPPT